MISEKAKMKLFAPQDFISPTSLDFSRIRIIVIFIYCCTIKLLTDWENLDAYRNGVSSLFVPQQNLTVFFNGFGVILYANMIMEISYAPFLKSHLIHLSALHHLHMMSLSIY